ncbi:sigma-70 family RNA polymerase sigma factor [Nocardioides endophyticus]|uniref:Sigma-70 family RNA polymerase sigma factor n=1 Tax=Nocardioides endophyticus TaxID=1353775 RepID=A0ABP8ZCD6_9ACTN
MTRETLAAEFEQQRGRLVAMAQRVLGSPADAEDVVQEAWLRLERQDPAMIDNLGGWLTTVVGRICIDVLRSRKVRPEAAYDDEPPELVVSEDAGSTPEDEALLADSVGLALLVVLDTLGPAERLAFVLHDVFAVPFDEIGQLIGRSTDASKMLASRARRKVQGAPPSAEVRRQQGAVVDAFLAAARTGDFAGLLRVLDPDVTWRVHTPRGVIVRSGATEVAAKAQRGIHTKVVARRVLVNGEPGIVAWDPSGRARSAMACTVVDGRIVEMVSVTDPERLAAIDLPAPPA